MKTVETKIVPQIFEVYCCAERYTTDFSTYRILMLEISSLWRIWLPVRIGSNPDELFKEKFDLASFNKIVGEFVLLL